MKLSSVVMLFSTPLFIAAVHAVGCRTPWGRRQPRQLLALYCAVGSALGLSLFLATDLPSFAFGTLISLGLGHVYFHVFNMSETARRIRILTSLLQGGSAQDLESYSSETVVAIRLERLLSLNQIAESQGSYRIVPSLMLHVARAMKRFEKCLFPSRLG